MEDMTFLQKQVIEHPAVTLTVLITFLILAVIVENREEIKFFVKKRSSKRRKGLESKKD